MPAQQVNSAYRVYSLQTSRTSTTGRMPGAHQAQALQALQTHFARRVQPFHGGLLVLPTGGGKTFTALRFLCRDPLTQGYKVLWLAHTHHLLEQAFASLSSEVGQIGEPKETLHVRMVSGTPGHNRVADIKPHDDVVIATLQTITRAYKNSHPRLTDWLAAAGDRLIMVFDEAHHAPAYSYRTLLLQLRDRQPGLYLLGLTATPVYGNEGQEGWLTKLFPGGILYQTTARELMASGVLARPVFEEHATNITVQFDEREYKKWLGTYRDLPEEIVSSLARNQDRNQQIVSTYVQNKDRYGKTIIFVDRWYQCEQVREMLLSRGVRADVVYSHVTVDTSGPEARNRRTSDDNHQALERFRAGDVDVLINVRMLTEGTDVPDVSTVFLTRQTTSHVLLTQMIGRSLRGTRFGGTDKAYIVSFVDNWKHLINWAEYTLSDGETLDDVPVPVRRPPLHLISIALVRDLARKMDQGLVVNSQPFRSLLPIGWYRADYLAHVEDTDDLEQVMQMVMVFEHEQAAYHTWLAALATVDLHAFGDEHVQLVEQRETIEAWRSAYFAAASEGLGDDLSMNLFHLARHVAFHEGAVPPFFAFAERDHHDLDMIAAQLIDRPLSPRDKLATLQTEYQRSDRYWHVIYPTFLFFKSQYDACENRLLVGEPSHPEIDYTKPECYRDREPSQEVKDQVRQRDGYQCRSCGEDTRSLLEVDHVAPYYLGGGNNLGNLQTLCKTCNQHKGISEINFRHNETMLDRPPAQFPVLEPPPVEAATNPAAWRRFVRRSVNFFYRCAAVADVVVENAPESTWSIRLWTNNNPQWLEPFLGTLLQQIQARCFEGGASRPAALTVSAPDQTTASSVASALLDPGPLVQPWAGLGIVTTKQHLRLVATDLLPLIKPGSSPRSFPMTTAASTLAAAGVLSAGRPIVVFTQTGTTYLLPDVPPDAHHATDYTYALSDYTRISSKEQICALNVVPDDSPGLYAVVLTRTGLIKRLTLSTLLSAAAEGRTISSGTVVALAYAHLDDDIIVVTTAGFAIRFPASDVPEHGAVPASVRAIYRGDGGAAIALAVAERSANTHDLVVVTSVGKAKRTPLAEYRVQRPDGSGLATSSVGGLVAAFLAHEQDEMIVLTEHGKAAHLRVADVPRQGRSTSGTSLIALNPNDRIFSALRLPTDRR